MIRAFERADTMAAAALMVKTFEKPPTPDVTDYYDQPGLQVLLDTFDKTKHSEQTLYDKLSAAEYVAVYETGGKITGLIRGSLDRLRTLAVDPQVHGQGVGRKLTEAFEQWAKQQGSVEIHVHAAYNAVVFYEKMGYETVGDMIDYEGLFTYNMVKHLTSKEK